MIDKKRDQISLPDILFWGGGLDETHELVILSKLIDWDKIIDEIAQYYSKKKGRKTKKLRMMIALLMLKHLYQLSDRDVVSQLQENFYHMYFCGVEPLPGHKNLHHSLMTHFRKKIGPDGVKAIEEEVLEAARRCGFIKGRKLITDTTVMEKNIEYPTDVGLLAGIGRKIRRIIDKGKELGVAGIEKVRTFGRKAKELLTVYRKYGRKVKEKREEITWEFIEIAEKMIAQGKRVKELIGKTIRQRIGKFKGAVSSDAAYRKLKRLMEELENIRKVGRYVIDQTWDVLAGKKIKDRVVSLHETHVRPIKKGKVGKLVEFGVKLLLNMVEKGFIAGVELFCGNPADVNLVEESIGMHEEVFGRNPESFSADRGFYSGSLVEDLRQQIKKVCIPATGNQRAPDSDKPWFKRLLRERSGIEAKISESKRKGGLDKSRYKGLDGDIMWAHLGVAALNMRNIARRIKNGEVDLAKLAIA